MDAFRWPGRRHFPQDLSDFLWVELILSPVNRVSSPDFILKFYRNFGPNLENSGKTRLTYDLVQGVVLVYNPRFIGEGHQQPNSLRLEQQSLIEMTNTSLACTPCLCQWETASCKDASPSQGFVLSIGTLRRYFDFVPLGDNPKAESTPGSPICQ